MIVIDAETSGISSTLNGILSLGAIDYENGDTFYGECQLTPDRAYHEKALEINGFTVEQIFDPSKQLDVQLYMNFVKWAAPKGNLLAGHNVGHFDILFLEELHTRSDIQESKFPFSYRTVDLHSVAYAKLGKSLTHEQICLELGLKPEYKPHHALKGAVSEAIAFATLLNHPNIYMLKGASEQWTA